MKSRFGMAQRLKWQNFAVLGKNIILRISIDDPLKIRAFTNPEDYLIMRIIRVILSLGLRGERSIKPYVIGRKNWIFSNTPRGAKASATIYSVVETAKENGLNPFVYLKYLFEKLPNLDIQDQDAVDELLPWSEALPSECRSKKVKNK